MVDIGHINTHYADEVFNEHNERMNVNVCADCKHYLVNIVEMKAYCTRSMAEVPPLQLACNDFEKKEM